jgi:hypothetical protein
MPNDAGFDLEAFKAHLNVIENHQPSAIPPLGPELQVPLSPATGPPVTPKDSLQGAMDTLNLPKETRAPDQGKPGTDLGPGGAEEARNHLAQEALQANPAEMRRLFPQLLKKISIYRNDHLNLYEIESGLHNAALSQDEKTMLTVLKEDYLAFSELPGHALTRGVIPVLDNEGVSAQSLTMVDKALNRNISDDPIYRQQAKEAVWDGLKVGSLAGFAIATFYRRSLPLLVVADAAAIGLIEGYEWLRKGGSAENQTYDMVKQNYKAFADKNR